MFIDKVASLTPIAKQIICDKATEYPHTGAYNAIKKHGTYLCRRCGLALFRADSQFASGCGWPSFDAEIPLAVNHIPDKDGTRTEIVCSRCDGHLGHIFTGEHHTVTNKRYCVNSASIDFVTNTQVIDSEEAIFAGGCFWGVDYFLRKLPGVLKVEVGYSGGHIMQPTYQKICEGNTGHYEAVRVLYDVAKTNYKNMLKRFLEIHDPTQRSGQGPDIGLQYQSAVFYFNKDQRQQAADLLEILTKKGFTIATRLIEASTFWPAEDDHQDYYGKHSKLPYCHIPVARFD